MLNDPRDPVSGLLGQIDAAALRELAQQAALSAGTIVGGGAYQVLGMQGEIIVAGGSAGQTEFINETVTIINSTVNVTASTVTITDSVVNITNVTITHVNVTVINQVTNFTVSTAWAIAVGVTWVINGPGILVVNAPLEICGRLILCCHTYPVWDVNQNDLAQPTPDKVVYRISATTPVDLTGIVPRANQQAIALVNVGEQTITLKENSASSVAANRFFLPRAIDLPLGASDSAILWYDPVDLRWVVLGDTQRGGSSLTAEAVDSTPSYVLSSKLLVEDRSWWTLLQPTAGQVQLRWNGKALSPASYSSSQNDLAFSAIAGIYRLTASTAVSITGIVKDHDDQVICLTNIGSSTITLSHDSGSSSAANRFLLPGAASMALPQYWSVILWYDADFGRWRVLAEAGNGLNTTASVCEGDGMLHTWTLVNGRVTARS